MEARQNTKRDREEADLQARVDDLNSDKVSLEEQVKTLKAENETLT